MILHTPKFYFTGGITANLGARWVCSDPESGIAYASWMPYRDSQLQPLLQRRRLRTGAVGRQSAQLRMEDGAAYFSCITATYYLLLTTYYSLLTTYYSLLTTYYLLLTTTTYYSLLTTDYLLLTAY